MVEAMTIRNTKTGEFTRFEADEEDGLFGIFVFIGNMRPKVLRLVVTATGVGAIAAFSAQKYVEKIKREVPTA